MLFLLNEIHLLTWINLFSIQKGEKKFLRFLAISSAIEKRFKFFCIHLNNLDFLVVWWNIISVLKRSYRKIVDTCNTDTQSMVIEFILSNEVVLMVGISVCCSSEEFSYFVVDKWDEVNESNLHYKRKDGINSTFCNWLKRNNFCHLQSI